MITNIKNNANSIIELKHTTKHICGARLKAAGVPKEDSRIYWVMNGNVTDSYFEKKLAREPENRGINLGTIKVNNKENGNIAETVLEFYNDITREVGIKNNILVIDLAKEMPKSTEFYYDFLHYSNQGSKKVAEIINSNLQPFLKNKFSEYLKP